MRLRKAISAGNEKGIYDKKEMGQPSKVGLFLSADVDIFHVPKTSGED
jgi:hypothetical protein